MAVGVGAAFATLRTRELFASGVGVLHVSLMVTPVSGLHIKGARSLERDASACS
jgi:hypothetical protein